MKNKTYRYSAYDNLKSKLVDICSPTFCVKQTQKTDKEILIEALDKIGVKYQELYFYPRIDWTLDRRRLCAITVADLFSKEMRINIPIYFDKQGEYIPGEQL